MRKKLSESILYSTVVAPHPKATVYSVHTDWHSNQMCFSVVTQIQTELTYVTNTLILLGSLQVAHNAMQFMYYSINVSCALVGRVEILLGKLPHYGFSIHHLRRQKWKWETLWEKHFKVTVTHLLFACIAHWFIWGWSQFYAVHSMIMYHSGRCDRT